MVKLKYFVVSVDSGQTRVQFFPAEDATCKSCMAGDTDRHLIGSGES